MSAEINQTQPQEAVAEVKPTEAPVQDPPVATPSKESEEFKANFERIAKQEKFQAEQRKKLEDERKAIEAERAEAAEYKKLKQLKSQDPLKVLETLGLSIDEIVNAANNPKNIDPIAAKALKAVEQLQEEIRQRDQAIETAKIQKMEKQLAAEIMETVKKSEYDIVDKLELHGEVREYMEQHFNKTGEILSIDDAAKSVNDHYVGLIKKVMGSKWLVEQPKVEEVKPEETISPTLTNKMVSEAPRTVKPRTEAERVAEAIKAFTNNRNI